MIRRKCTHACAADNCDNGNDKMSLLSSCALGYQDLYACRIHLGEPRPAFVRCSKPGSVTPASQAQTPTVQVRQPALALAHHLLMAARARYTDPLVRSPVILRSTFKVPKPGRFPGSQSGWRRLYRTSIYQTKDTKHLASALTLGEKKNFFLSETAHVDKQHQKQGPDIQRHEI